MYLHLFTRQPLDALDTVDSVWGT